MKVYGIAFTRYGSPNDDIVGWWSDSSANETHLFVNRDDALEKCDLIGWTGYVREFQESHKVPNQKRVYFLELNGVKYSEEQFYQLSKLKSFW
jgi:hypothetical protein